MKLFELLGSHYHWNEAYIDEDNEIWWYSWWSRLERVLSTWLHHLESVFEVCNSYCRPYSINSMFLVFVVFFNLLNGFSTG